MTRRAWTLFVAGAVAGLAGCGGGENPKAASGAPPAPPAENRAPLVPKKEAADWCGEHGVPESACTRCNADLIPGFKSKGDWCEMHSLPKSQCIACDPSLEAKWKARAPAGSPGK